MSKYIKLEDALKGLNIGYGKYDYVSKVSEYYHDLPTIEVSEDCISRVCLIEKLKDHKAFIIQAWNNDFSIMADIDKSRVDELDNCISVVMNAPSVLPSMTDGKWIPVSERLPEEMEWVLVTDGIEVWVDQIEKVVITGSYRWGECMSPVYEYEEWHWQPLPEPYRESEEEQMASEMRDYCERYEPTYNSEDGSM